ncbi:Glycoside hydrolase, family 1 [Corchorus olitorius]|uniref:Glycoside hydrolase, family 1 n=1 Tax=Corchorus olitorius TaxID=93759 RepID=A0A1R3KJK6_9ROSI|nr:Glycoside hydrolase, family 1 [Corchorus olitorius]
MAGNGYYRPVLVAADNECDEVMTLPQVKGLGNAANRFIAEEIPETTAVDIAAGVTASDVSQETAANDPAIIHIESTTVEPVVSTAAPIRGQSCVEVRRSVRERTQPKRFERIVDGSTGDEAADFYHKYKEDIKLMKKIGLESFRFSISWSRVLPNITPFATLLHFDHPQALEDEYGAFGSRKFIDDFAEYADFAFKTFGDRVKHWVTMNEPNAWITFIFQADAAWSGQGGSTTSRPYVMGHNLILAHGAAAKIYKEKYQVIFNSEILIFEEAKFN